jgi:hypothetical protein
VASTTDRARRLAAAAVAALLLATVPAGCASQQEKYCSALKDDNAQLKKLASDKPAGEVLHRGLAIFQDLQSKAPQDIAGDWADFTYAWKSLVDAFDAAGVDPAHFDPEHQPAGVSTGQFQAIKQAAAELESQKVQAAASRIEDHAQSVCKVDLGGSGLGGAGGL